MNLSIHSVFLLFAISLKPMFRSVLQNFAKAPVLELFLIKSEAANIQERTSKILSCRVCKIFQNSFFLEQLSVNVSISGVGAAQPYQRNKYLIYLNKQINTLTSNQSYLSSPLPLQMKKRIFSRNI